jgi:hypothetical protein
MIHFKGSYSNKRRFEEFSRNALLQKVSVFIMVSNHGRTHPAMTINGLLIAVLDEANLEEAGNCSQAGSCVDVVP